MKIIRMNPLYIALLAAPCATAQSPQTIPTVLEEVVVTGFRQAIARSLDNKRDAVNTKESIVSEDMGKMPDLNLAEAIQRVPGVTIVREGGEGRQISLRGLGADFTHVTLNGMEVPASAGGLDSSGGSNRGRAFDFNVFSAELFNRIDVNKSALASIEEGGIAGSVELFTMRPLDNPEAQLAVSGQAGYNDLSEEVDPRSSIIYSDSNEAETIGWMFSAAYTERTAFQDGFGTVRWSGPTADNNRTFAGENDANLDLAEANNLWYPRLPRQDSFHHTQERIGLSGALQFRPTDTLELGLNYVSSEFDSEINSHNAFAQFREIDAKWGWRNITVENVTVASQGGNDYAVAGEFSGVGLRTESRRQIGSTDFQQITADLAWDISDILTLTAMVGSAGSEYIENYFRANIETLLDNPETAAVNDGGAVFSYDFTRNANVAAIAYDIDVTNPNNFYIVNNEIIRDYLVDRSNNTQRIDLEWAVSASSVVKLGAIRNDRDLNSQEYRQDEPLPTDLAAISEVYTFDDTGDFGSDTELKFLVLDFDKAIPAFGSNRQLVRGGGIQTWLVEEETTGIYVEYNLDTEIAGRGFRANLGARSVTTDVTATGWASEDLSFVEENSFTNVLPSFNLAYEMSDDFILRLGLAKTLTRASMASLSPSKVYRDRDLRVNGGNSQLQPLLSTDLNISWEWYFSEEAVLAFNYFRKDIESFISSPPNDLPLTEADVAVVQALYPDQPELSDGVWEYRLTANTEGTELDGFEIAYQQTFTSLPGFLSNFGLLANYSVVDASTTVSRNAMSEKAPLTGLSETSYNATLFYEVEAWGGRIAVNNRDDYVTNNIGSNGNYSENTTGPTHMDMSVFYNVSDNITLTFEVVNFTDEYERRYTTGPDGSMNLVREYNHTGRQMFLGVRASY